MKKVILLFFLFFTVSTYIVAQDGIKFFEGSWEEALAKAEKENKLIFLDAYARWCGPCRSMDKNVFTNKEVGDYYNKNFINMKVDWETDLGSQLHKKYPIRAYPSMMFISGKGKRVTYTEGYLDAKSLLKFAEHAQDEKKSEN